MLKSAHLRSSVLLPLAMAFLALLVFAGPALADTVTVTSTLDSGVGTLRQALLDASPGDVVTFSITMPATITLTSGEMTRSGELTINGPGSASLTISGNSASRAITTSSSLTLTGVTIRDCTDGAPGAIYCGGAITMTDVAMVDNTSSGGNGALWSGGAVTLSDSLIQGNNALGGDYGAFHALGNVTMSNTQIISNTASGAYGAFYSDDSVTITNSQFISNTALGGKDGGFHAVNDVTMTSCDFVGNTASIGHGGFTADGSATVSGCLFQENAALDGDGGAFEAYGSVTITSSDLISNTASRVFGAFFSGAQCVISDTRMIGNTASESYGVFYAEGSVTITNSQLISNTAETGHCGAFAAEQAVALTNTDLISNTAATVLGAFSSASNVTISGGTIEGNTALGGNCGAFYAANDVTLTDTQMISNTAHESYGAFETSGAVTISDSHLERNTALNGNGGALYARDAVTITGSYFVSNTASTSYSGGAVYADDQVTVANTTFRGNGAVSGGAMHIAGAGSGLDMRDCVVADSPTGGGLALENGGVAVIENTTIHGNHAGPGPSSGGGIHFAGDSIPGTELHLLHCTLTDNDATIDGGGLWVYQAQAWLTDTLVAGNTLSIGDHDPSDVSGAVTSGGGNLVGNGTGMTGMTHGVNGDQVGTDVAPIDALTGDLGDYGGDTETVPLLPGSPAIDAGVASSLTRDQRGVTRDPSPDVGAYEARAFGLSYVSGGGQSTLVSTQFSDPLVAQVTGTAGDPVDGGMVAFTAPGSGASATLPDDGLATISGGTATITATANSAAGSYQAQATLPGLTPVTYDLENTSAVVQGPGSPWIRNYGTVAGGWTDFSTFPRWTADVNGDGLCDVVAFGNKATYVSLCTGGALGGPQEWIRMYGPAAGGWTDYDTFPRMLGDVNGDGMEDIVAFGNKATYVSLSTASGFLPPAEWIGLFGPSAGGWNSQNTFPRMLGDVNGDGRDDIVAFGNRATYVSLSTGASFLPPGEWIGLYGPAAGGWTSYDTFPRFVDDVNGDGLDDIVAFGNKATYVSLSTGSSFGPPTEWAIGLGPTAGGWLTQDGQTRLVGDIDGDGKTDIVAFGGTATYAWKSTTQTLGLFSWFYTNDRGWTSQNLYPRDLGDVTGDGKLDVVGFGSDGVYVQAAP